jgi:hypothetical protein
VNARLFEIAARDDANRPQIVVDDRHGAEAAVSEKFRDVIEVRIRRDKRKVAVHQIARDHAAVSPPDLFSAQPDSSIVTGT